MKRFWYSSILLLCMSLGLRAQDSIVYNPDNPPEPTPTPTLYTLALEARPSGSGYYYGNGRYEVGGTAWVYAYPYSNYVFSAWMEGDSLVSTQPGFQYTMPERNVLLTALYDYSPADPGEPTVQPPNHTVRLFCDPPTAGYFSNSGVSTLPEGNQTWLYAYGHTGFRFVGWYRGDSLLTDTYYLPYTMGTKNDTLVGRFAYEPSDPNEPQGSSDARYNLSVLSRTANPGETIAYPVYLMNENLGVHSLVFDLLLPEGILTRCADAALSSRKNGHTLNVDSIAPNTYRFTVSGSEMLPLYGSSGVLLTVPLQFPAEWPAGDTIHRVSFSNAVLYSTLGDLYCPVKNAVLGIVSDTTTLYASFYPDLYLNRVKFVNLSSQAANAFYWRFGDGTVSTERNPMHVYDKPGNYEVFLWASSGVKSDSIRISVNIAEESTWRMEGSFTLNTALSDVKNFTSLDDLFRLMGRSNLTGNLMVHVQSNQTFGLDFTPEQEQRLDRIGKMLLQTGNRLHLVSDSAASVNFDGFQSQAAFEVLKNWNRALIRQRVSMNLFGVPVDFSAIFDDRSLTVCSESWSPAVDLRAFSPGSTIHVRLTQHPRFTTGFDLCDEDSLHGMWLVNDSSLVDSLFYETFVNLNDTAFVLQKIAWAVLPRLHGVLDERVPLNGTQLYGTWVQFAWHPIVNALYDLYVWETGSTMPTKAVRSGLTSNNTYLNDLNYAKTYCWKVVAVGTCNTIESPVDTFSVRTLPDMQVAEVVLPGSMQAGDWVEFKFRVVNKGGNSDSYYSNDQLSLATDSTLTKTRWLNSLYHFGYTEKDSSYWVVYGLTLPYDSIDYTRVVFRIDDQNWILESNDANNLWVSAPVVLNQPVLDETDYRILCDFNQRTDGLHWNNRWYTADKKMLANSWQGVTFHRGRVVGIHLSGNGLSGELPMRVFSLPMLRTLELSNNRLTGSLERLKDSLVVANDSLTELNLSNNVFDGELSAFAACFKNLNNLNVSGNRLSRINQALPSTIQYLSLQNQQLSIPDFRLAMQPSLILPSLCWYNHQLQGPDSSWIDFYLIRGEQYLGQIYHDAGGYHLYNWNSVWNQPPDASFTLRQNYGLAYGSNLKVRIPFDMGDANMDDLVNVLDVQHSLNFVFEENPRPFNYYAANTFQDETLNVQDIVSTVNLVLISPDTVLLPPTTMLRSSSDESRLVVSGNQLLLQAAVPVSAVDVTLKHVAARQLRLLLNQSNFQFVTRNTADGVRFIAFSPNGTLLSAGEHALAELSAQQVEVVSVALSDRQAQAVPIRIPSILTTLSEDEVAGLQVRSCEGLVTIDLDARAERMTLSLYNAQGMLLDATTWTEVSAGRQTVDYTKRLSGGVYLIRLDVKRGDARWSKNVKLIVSK